MRNGNNCKWTCGMFRSESIDETTAIGLSYRVCSMGHSLQMIEKDPIVFRSEPIFMRKPPSNCLLEQFNGVYHFK